MIPFEALLPYGVMLGLLTVCGGGMSALHFIRGGGRRDLWNVDAFDRALQERDMRLVNKPRDQSDSPIAPEVFKYNSIWKLQKPSAS